MTLYCGLKFTPLWCGLKLIVKSVNKVNRPQLRRVSFNLGILPAKLMGGQRLLTSHHDFPTVACSKSSFLLPSLPSIRLCSPNRSHFCCQYIASPPSPTNSPPQTDFYLFWSIGFLNNFLVPQKSLILPLTT